MTAKIYYNPQCSKCRETLKILQEKGVDTEITEYLITPPNAETLKTILATLNMKPRQLMRKHESEYKDNNLDNPELSDAQLIQAIIDFPKIMERPIVVNNGKIAIGRPPVNVLDII
ncbi:Arsenate reductase [hydrothermal vent metagenome]|uniref:Arsenate reductase n=1 Tax=hydrothermal vent metagenome TaxID=652676 RepID=A0A3B1AHE8_9ZZZZ